MEIVLIFSGGLLSEGSKKMKGDGIKFPIIIQSAAIMKNVRRSSLIFGIIITIIFFIGFFLMASESPSGTYVLYAGLALGIIYWIWAIIEVIGANDLKKYQKNFWLIIVVAVPFFGAFLYNIIHQSRNKIAN